MSVQRAIVNGPSEEDLRLSFEKGTEVTIHLDRSTWFLWCEQETDPSIKVTKLSKPQETKEGTNFVITGIVTSYKYRSNSPTASGGYERPTFTGLYNAQTKTGTVTFSDPPH